MERPEEFMRTLARVRESEPVRWPSDPRNRTMDGFMYALYDWRRRVEDRMLALGFGREMGFVPDEPLHKDAKRPDHTEAMLKAKLKGRELDEAIRSHRRSRSEILKRFPNIRKI